MNVRLGNTFVLKLVLILMEVLLAIVMRAILGLGQFAGVRLFSSFIHSFISLIHYNQIFSK